MYDLIVLFICVEDVICLCKNDYLGKGVGLKCGELFMKNFVFYVLIEIRRDKVKISKKISFCYF